NSKEDVFDVISNTKDAGTLAQMARLLEDQSAQAAEDGEEVGSEQKIEDSKEEFRPGDHVFWKNGRGNWVSYQVDKIYSDGEVYIKPFTTAEGLSSAEKSRSRREIARLVK